LAAQNTVELLRHVRDEHSADPVGILAGEMLPDIEQDRGTLRSLCESLGYKPDALKEAGLRRSKRSVASNSELVLANR
jgi:hypothetical protein